MTSIAKLCYDTGKENQLELSCKRTKGQKTMVEKALISGINTTLLVLDSSREASGSAVANY